MNQAIKLGRYSSHSSQFSIFSSPSDLFSISSRQRAATVRLLQVAGCNDPKQLNFHSMDKHMKSSDQDDNNNIRNVMEESFGAKYFTRCDDEGFGGIYGSNEEHDEGVMEESFGLKYTTRCDDEGFGGIYGSKEECNTEIKIIKDPARRGSNDRSEVKEKEHNQNLTQVTQKV